MQTRNELKPTASELSAYQKQIRQVLETIAALEPEAGWCVSETAILVTTAKISSVKECREILRTAFELMADRGYVRREYIHWRFKRRFAPADVTDLLAWNGKWQPTQQETASYSR